jgi:integrase
MAYIRKYRDGWRAEVQRHGMRASFAAPTKREVQQWALRKEAEIDGLKLSKGMTFDQACAKYVSTVSRDKAEGAALWEERRFTEMAAFFGGEARISQINSDRIGEWRDWRLKQVSASTVLRDRSLLQHLFQLAADEWKVIQSNPFRGVRFPQHNPPRHQVWTWRLIKRVLRASNRNEREIQTIRAFHIALHTGMRLSEILSAKLEGNVAVLERDKVSGKASPPVKVPLPRKGPELFAKYQPFTIAPDIASATFSDLTDELLIDGLTFHDSRASALTWLSRRFDVMTLARISRHKNLKTLMDTYYRETAEQIAERLR